jgi:hypothetical protein
VVQTNIPIQAMLKNESTERRRVQRIHLLEPLGGKIRGKKVHVLDISLRGVRVGHSEVLGSVGEECELSFEWEGQTLVLDCRIRRSTVQRIGKAAYARTLYHSGLELRPSGRSLQGLREMIEEHVERALDEQKADARGVPPQESSRESATNEFVRHELVNQMWRSVRTTDREQPPNGFTIAANHSRLEVQMLKKAYLSGDESAREAIQKIAKLSLDSSETFPPMKCEP